MLDIIEEAQKIYEDGGLILYPTDTIWGIGCDPFNAAAIQRLSKLKKRQDNKALILLVSSIDMLKEYVRNLHPRTETLLFYHQRPLTIIYNNPLNLPQNILAEDGSIGIRVTHDPFCKHFIDQIKKPLVSTSANISGEPYPKDLSMISESIKNGVDYIVNLGRAESPENQPSVIAKVNEKGDLEFLRA